MVGDRADRGGACRRGRCRTVSCACFHNTRCFCPSSAEPVCACVCATQPVSVAVGRGRSRSGRGGVVKKPKSQITTRRPEKGTHPRTPAHGTQSKSFPSTTTPSHEILSRIASRFGFLASPLPCPFHYSSLQTLPFLSSPPSPPKKRVVVVVNSSRVVSVLVAGPGGEGPGKPKGHFRHNLSECFLLPPLLYESLGNIVHFWLSGSPLSPLLPLLITMDPLPFSHLPPPPPKKRVVVVTVVVVVSVVVSLGTT